MITRFVFLLLLAIGLLAKAQLTELKVNIKGKQIVYADKKTVYAYDNKAFYIYKDTATYRYFGQRYACDTVKWGERYSLPASLFYGGQKNYLKFSDRLNGIVVIGQYSHPRKYVTLKTTDGGKNWGLLHELPDSVVDEVVFHNFNNYIIGSKILYHNGKFSKLTFDTTGNVYQGEYGSGAFVFSSVYSKTTYVSVDEGLTWNSHTIPTDTGASEYRYLTVQHVVKGKVYLLHRPSPYNIPEISRRSFLTTLDLATQKIIQKRQSFNFDYLLVDRKGDPYLAKRDYRITYPSNYSVDYSLHLLAKDTTVTTSRLTNVGNPVEYYHGNNWNIVRMRDSVIYLFDHTDCDNIDLREVTLDGDNVTAQMKSTEIDPIQYPRLTVLDAQQGDTVSNLCCLYLLPSNNSPSLQGNKVKVPRSDSLIVLLTQVNGGNALCVSKTNTKAQVGPLGIKSENLTDKAAHLYPNPSSDFIQLSNVEQAFDLKVVNDMGQVLLQKSALAPQEKVDLRHLDTGHYSILITFDKGSTHRFSFLKF